jgi:hypothetical protein
MINTQYAINISIDSESITIIAARHAASPASFSFKAYEEKKATLSDYLEYQQRQKAT